MINNIICVLLFEIGAFTPSAAVTADKTETKLISPYTDDLPVAGPMMKANASSATSVKRACRTSRLRRVARGHWTYTVRITSTFSWSVGSFRFGRLYANSSGAIFFRNYSNERSKYLISNCFWKLIECHCVYTCSIAEMLKYLGRSDHIKRVEVVQSRIRTYIFNNTFE